MGGLLKIKEWAEKLGIRTPYELHKRTGLQFVQCDRLLNKGVSQYHDKTLSQLAEGLGVPVPDLFRDPDETTS